MSRFTVMKYLLLKTSWNFNNREFDENFSELQDLQFLPLKKCEETTNIAHKKYEKYEVRGITSF